MEGSYSLPFSVGDQIIWQGGSAPIGSSISIKKGSYHGKVAWIGQLNGRNWVAGIEFNNTIKNGCDGSWKNRRLFSCENNYGLFLSVKVLQKNSKNISAHGSMTLSSSDQNTPNVSQREDDKLLLTQEEPAVQSTQESTSSSSSKKYLKSKSKFFRNGKKHNGVGVENETSKSTPIETASNRVTNQSHKSDRTVKQKQPTAIFTECHIEDVTIKPKTGIHNIFSWFTKRHKADNNGQKITNTGSTLSLNSASNTLKFLPLNHSASADSPSGWKKMMKIKAIQRREPDKRLLEPSKETRRNSNVSLQSNMSSGTSSRRPKKRRAPEPPVIKHKDPIYSNEGILENKGGNPIPPSASAEMSRPISSLSSVSSYSVSDNSTMKSSFPPDSISSSTVSLFDKLVGAPYVKNSISLSPKPWFKRKHFSKSLKNEATPQSDGKIYDLWMPGMQFANRNLTLNSSKSNINSLIQTRRCSGLSNISDLDRAAQEIVQIDKQQKNANFPQATPHFLQQADINPTENKNQSNSLSYKNICTKTSHEHLPDSSSATTHIDNTSIAVHATSSENLCCETFSKFQDIQPVYSLKVSKSAQSSPPGLSPIQKSTLDPEVFYRLAKNTNITPSTSKLHSHDSTPLQKVSARQSQPNGDKVSRNFGLRMNNLFTPDVSTIQEGSESITSSATPFEDVEKDFQALAASLLDSYSDNRSFTSDFYNEISVNLEPSSQFESFNMISKAACSPLLTSFGHESRDNFSEIIKAKERENFHNWQRLKQGADESFLEQEVSTDERNTKWICDSCTLINSPRRLQCEVCNCIRPPRPLRADHAGEVVRDVTITHTPEGCSPTAIREEFAQPATADQNLTERELFAINLDAELLKYFDDPYKNDPSTFSKPNQPAGNKSESFDLREIREARIKKFSGVVDHHIGRDAIDPALSESNMDTIAHALKEHSKVEFKQKVQEFEYIFINGNKTTFEAAAKGSGKVQKNCGAVRSAVSLINQWGQKEASEKAAPPKALKRPVAQASKKDSLLETFSDSMSDSSTPSDVMRSNSGLKLDLDIMSTVNKFDEIAAMAEVTQLTRPNPRFSRMKRRNAKPLFQQSFTSFQPTRSDSNLAKPQTKVNLRVNGAQKWDNLASVPHSANATSFVSNGRERNYQAVGVTERRPTHDTFDSYYSEKKDVDSGVISGNSTDSMEENVHRRSLSIGPNTFELLSRKEFGCISAHQSERPSPTFELDNGFQTKFATDSSDNTESYSDMERGDNIIFDHTDLPHQTSPVINDSEKLFENDKINGHLKRLEKAIEENRHKDAAVLAHELAHMQLTKSTDQTGATNEIDLHHNPDVNVTEQHRELIKEQSPLSIANGAVAKSIDTVETISPAIKRRAVKSAIIERTLQTTPTDEKFFVEMYIEDRATHQGPFPLAVKVSMTVSELKKTVEREYGFPVEVQRWILGRRLADDDSQSLSSYRVTVENCPVFLYLVAPDNGTLPKSDKKYVKSSETREDQQNVSIKQTKESKPKGKPSTEKKAKIKRSVKTVMNEAALINPQPAACQSSQSISTYPTVVNRNAQLIELVEENPHALENGSWRCPQCTLINHNNRPGCEACATDRPSDTNKIALRDVILDHQACISNAEPFECVVCLTDFKCNEGVVLRECLHMFCRDCLRYSIVHSEMADVKCPFRNDQYACQFSLQEREIKDLVSEEEYLKHHDKSIRQAAGTMMNVFHCKTANCKGFCEFEDNVNTFACNVCRKLNCLTCQAQHADMTCKEYQDDLATKQDDEAIKTKLFFDDIIRRGNGMACPKCSVMLVRKWGCDWMRCPMCRSEICWVTRSLRWGPKGPGDNSGGCKCGVNGRKCHPKCTYCH